MEPLLARVNFADNTIQFSGPGTFSAKEQIKSLGAARWNSQLKCWDVRMVVISLEDLKSRFPQAQFELSGDLPPSIAPEPSAASEPRANLPPSMGVADFLGKLRSVLGSAFPARVFVRGVVSKVKRHDSWTYLDLIDELQPDTKLECVIRSSDGDVEKGLRDVGFELEENLQVMCGVMVGMRAKAGVISLRIVEFVPEYTLGKLAAERDKTNERLKHEGVFTKNKQLKLPFLPRRLGVLTSAKGTVVHDFLASLREANFGFELYLCHVSVQGSEAKSSILEGFDKLEELGLDAILLMRGGGSPAELAIFNDYEVAKRVCLAKLPVISAIGHQEDQSSVQDVSFQACGVPKDVGRYFADIVLLIRRLFTENVAHVRRESERVVERATRDFAQLRQSIVDRARALVVLFEERAGVWQRMLPIEAARCASELASSLSVLGERVVASALRVIEKAGIRLQAFAALPQMMVTAIDRAEERVLAKEQLIRAASPDVQLSRGFAIIRLSESGGIITRGRDLAKGANLEIEFKDSKAAVCVTGMPMLKSEDAEK